MVDWPSNPTDGQVHTEGGQSWTYHDPPGVWRVAEAAAGGGGGEYVGGMRFDRASGAVLYENGNLTGVRSSASGYDFTFPTPMEDENYIVLTEAVQSGVGTRFFVYSGETNRSVNGFRIVTADFNGNGLTVGLSVMVYRL